MGVKVPSVDRALQSLTTTQDLTKAVAGASFIQEAITENLEAKRDLLAEIDRYGSEKAIFASSTSGIPISEIVSNCSHPERCIGAHPYNPPYLIPLVEISVCEQTDSDVLATAVAFYEAMGKEVIILLKDAPGFIANRLQVALYREAVDLVSRGVCTIQDVDKACVFGPGLRWAFMGPNLVFHLGSGPSGIQKGLRRYTPAFEYWLKDMASWKSFPEDWPSTAQAGIEGELKDRSSEQGQDYESITRYRDAMLVELLKLHKKL
jgi:3-hydroxyacyl-CoA dehydrogenase